MKQIKFLTLLIIASWRAMLNTIAGDKTSVITYNGMPATIEQINPNEYFIDTINDCFLADQMEV